MAIADLREWIALLEREGELRRISAEVDPHLEVTEIVDRTVKAGGPALLFERPGSEHPLLVNQFGTERRMCLAFGVVEPRRGGDEARRRARDAAAGRSCRQAPRPQAAQVDRRLAPEHGAQGRLPGDRPARRPDRPRCPADPDLLAARRRPVHHPAGRDHPRPGDRRPQRRDVPDAGARPSLDRDALAAPQGRPRRLPGERRADGGGGRARPRSDHRLLRERASPQAHRRADVRRVPARRGGRRRQGRERRPRGPRRGRDRARGLRRAGRPHRGGPVRRPHRLLHRRQSRSRSST